MIGSNAFNYINVLNKAADASWTRNEVIANNIANVATPHYKRKDIKFEDYLKDEIKKEVTGLCGAYLDEGRGVLKVPGLVSADYPPRVPGLPAGSYHVYDYLFFYRNLQKNVGDRVNAYLATQQ